MRTHFDRPALLSRPGENLGPPRAAACEPGGPRHSSPVRRALIKSLRAAAAALALTTAAATCHAARNDAGDFDGRRAFAHTRKQVEFGPRPAGSEALGRARRHIVDELKSYGLKVTADEFTAKTPIGARRMANVAAELPGESADFIILASHYDTKLYKNFRFVGANDGASSTGVLLELARALARGPRRNHFTYRFVFFDGEEAFCAGWDDCGRPGEPDNTYGSRRYVARLREGGELRKARALVLLDMVGYRDLEIGRESSSTPWLVDLVWRAARGRGHAKHFVERAENVGGDDHAPFLAAGVPSVDLIQLDTYPHWHTPADTLDKISPASLQAVGETVLAALPMIEERLKQGEQGPEGRGPDPRGKTPFLPSSVLPTSDR